MATTTIPGAASEGRLLRVGIPGLDDVLGGGLAADRVYLLQGAPGAGKTTLALQFLRAGVAQGERVLYVTLSETGAELRGVARSHGWDDLAGVDVLEILPPEDMLEADEQNTLFHPAEIELGETTRRILAAVEQLQPSRLVLDSLSEVRLLAGSSLRYRRQILALKQFFAGRGCTVLLLDDMTTPEPDLQVQSVVHAVLRLEQSHVGFGATRRRLVVEKYRGRAFRDGYHDYRIAHGGLRVFPRLVAADHSLPHVQSRIASGLATFDTLLGGGIEKGTSTLLVGAPGTGKSSLAVQFAVAAAQRGENAALFIFDETVQTLRTRCEGLGMPIGALVDARRIVLRQVDPAELSPGELVQEIRDQVAQRGVSVLVVDSLNGYLNAMPDERYLIAQLHELLTFLGHAGVATMLVGAQHGIIGTTMHSPVDASYLADAVVLLRYFETDGEVRQAISVVKKRGGDHERSIHSLAMGPDGIRIGAALRDFRGILTGVPERIEAPRG